MPWFFKDKKVYEGTVVEVLYPKSSYRYYYVDTCVSGHHLDEAMVLDKEIIAIMKTKPHARKAKISQRRLKIYQSRQSFVDWCKQQHQESKPGRSFLDFFGETYIEIDVTII
jgi:hypothetical protein